MDISRGNKLKIADIVLRALARGLCAVSMFDRRVAEDIATLGDGFSFAVCAGTGEDVPGFRLKTENGRFARAGTDTNGADVIIRFKDVSGAIPVLLGRISLVAAFAQHRMLIWGNLRYAVTLFRIIDTTGAYLYPRFSRGKATIRVPDKQAPSLFVYMAMLFFGASSEKTGSNATVAEVTKTECGAVYRESGKEAAKAQGLGEVN